MNIGTRFAKYYTKGSPEDCWEWTGGKTSDGYGMIKVNSKMVGAHRLALEIYLGRPITQGMKVLHSCDNPSCVNPNHLREGTQKENIDDMHSRNRHVGNKKLTYDQVADIRSRVGQSQRALAAEFGISKSTISHILNGITWTDRVNRDRD